MLIFSEIRLTLFRMRQYSIRSCHALTNVVGFVQFIESVPVSEVIRNDGSIVNFLRKQAPSDTAPLGIASELMDNYVRSCGRYY